jgi:predicted Zn-dependent protease
LLSTAEHELGHEAGLKGLDASVGDLLSGAVSAGSPADIDALFAQGAAS